ncbi:polysaccharide deacetylase family protein [bacterium]|nr:polysaccharide deacetylase family protein [bacterium]
MKPLFVEVAQRSPYYLLDSLGIIDWVISRRKSDGNLPLYIPSYHRFSEVKETIPTIPRSISQKAFKEQMEYISRNFEPVPLSLIAFCIHKREPFPKNCITITIDDGYKDNYLYAFPILKSLGIPATIFLTTSYIDGVKTPWEAKITFAIKNTSLREINLKGIGRFHLGDEKKRYLAAKMIVKRLKKFTDRQKNRLVEELIRICKVNVPPELGKELMLSWEEVREMSENGIEFGAHSLTHPILTNMPLKDAREEIVLSKRQIEENLGNPPLAFAYPNGDFNEEIVRIVREAGFLCAVTTMIEEVKPWSNPYKIGRVFGMDEDMHRFKAIISGIYYKINNLWGLIR